MGTLTFVNVYDEKDRFRIELEPGALVAYQSDPGFIVIKTTMFAPNKEFVFDLEWPEHFKTRWQNPMTEFLMDDDDFENFVNKLQEWGFRIETNLFHEQEEMK